MRTWEEYKLWIDTLADWMVLPIPGDLFTAGADFSAFIEAMNEKAQVG